MIAPAANSDWGARWSASGPASNSLLSCDLKSVTSDAYRSSATTLPPRFSNWATEVRLTPSA